MNIEKLKTAIENRKRVNRIKPNSTSQHARELEMEFLQGVAFALSSQDPPITLPPAVIICMMSCRSISTL